MGSLEQNQPDSYLRFYGVCGSNRAFSLDPLTSVTPADHGECVRRHAGLGPVIKALSLLFRLFQTTISRRRRTSALGQVELGHGVQHTYVLRH